MATDHRCTCTKPHLCPEADDLWTHLLTLPHDGTDQTSQIRQALALQIVQHLQARDIATEEPPHHEETL